MIGMKSTVDFIQIRTAHIKLRRELQVAEFLTLVEVEHAILRSKNGEASSVRSILLDEGYSSKEIERTISSAIGKGLLKKEECSLSIKKERLSFARCLLIIDLVAITGRTVKTADDNSGNILIPGYSNLYGNQINKISNEIDAYAPNSNYSRSDFANDITWLTENKFILIK